MMFGLKPAHLGLKPEALTVRAGPTPGANEIWRTRPRRARMLAFSISFLREPGRFDGIAFPAARVEARTLDAFSLVWRVSGHADAGAAGQRCECRRDAA